MTKLNVISASVLMMIGATASAGTISTTIAGGTVFATENFRGSTAAATDTITPGPLSYSLSTITAVNPGATVWFTVRLTGGTFAAVPGIGTFSFAGATLVATGAGVVGGTVTRSTDRTTVQVAITNNTAGTITLGLGAFGYTPAAGNIDGVNTTLATAGATVTASVGLTTVAPGSLEATTPLTTVDGPLPTAPIAVAARAINTPQSSSFVNFGGRIDLTASPAGSGFTIGTTPQAALPIASYTFVNIAGVQNVRAGTGDFTLLNGNAGVNLGAVVTVTPRPGEAFPVGSVLSLNTNINCGGGTVIATTGSGTTAFTGATAPTAKTLSTTVAVVSATEYFVCLTAPSAGNLATPLTVSLVADVIESSTTELIDNATGTIFPLIFNGSQVDVKNYFPNALASFGYQSFIRVINTGTVAAAISGAFITETGGPTAVGGSFQLFGGSLAAGAARTFTGAQIESVLGAPGAGDRPRLRLTAPTNGLTVQYYLQNPNGTITEISSSQ